MWIFWPGRCHRRYAPAEPTDAGLRAKTIQSSEKKIWSKHPDFVGMFRPENFSDLTLTLE